MGAPRKPPIRIPGDIATLAYLAGIVDGEGHIGSSVAVAKRSLNESRNVRVVVINTDLRLIEWLEQTLGGSRGTLSRTSPRWKTSYRWCVYGHNADRLLRAVLPFLLLKREQAELAIALRAGPRTAFTELPPGVVRRRKALASRLGALTKRGPH